MSEQPQTQPEPLAQHHQFAVHYPHPQYDQQQWPESAGRPGTPPADRRRVFFRKHGKLLGLLVGTFVIAGGLGVGIGRATFDPQVITRTETKTEYRTVTKEVTPKDCIKALDLAAVMVGDLSEAPGIVGDALTSAYDHDVVGINAVTERLKTSKANLDKQKAPLAAANASCRLQEDK